MYAVSALFWSQMDAHASVHSPRAMQCAKCATMRAPDMLQMCLGYTHVRVHTPQWMTHGDGAAVHIYAIHIHHRRHLVFYFDDVRQRGHTERLVDFPSINRRHVGSGAVE